MSIDAHTVVNQGSRTAARVVGDRAVVVVIDAQKLHTLNEVGTRVWELSNRASLASIAETIAREYDVSREAALADVLAFAEALVANGLLEVVSEP